MKTPADILAFDTSTDTTHIGLCVGDQQHVRALPGGAQASATLIGECLKLLAESGSSLAALDAIAFGSGPGSFTGLRTACAVAQGFALGANKPVIPVPTLLAVAMDAHLVHGHTDVLAAMDARMSEVYAAEFRIVGGRIESHGPARALKPDALLLREGQLLAGNAHRVYPRQLSQLMLTQAIDAAPTGQALLACAAQLFAQGAAVDAAAAQPEYVRNQVAQTEAERAAAKRIAAEAAA